MSLLDATANSLYRHTTSLLDAITYIISPAFHVATGCHRHGPHTSIPCRYWMPPPIALILAYHVATGCHQSHQHSRSLPETIANSSHTGILCRYWMPSLIQSHRSADLFWHTMSLLDVMTHHISRTFQRCRTRHLHTSHHTHATVTGTARPAPPTADGDELATAPTAHQPATPEHAAPGGASPPEDETSSSDNTDTASLSDPQPTEEDTTSAESVSPAPPPKKKKKNHKTRTPTTSTTPLVDFLDLSNVPTRSKQPQPPRRLKLPTVAPDTLRRLRNLTKVVDVDDVLYPRLRVGEPARMARLSVPAVWPST